MLERSGEERISDRHVKAWQSASHRNLLIYRPKQHHRASPTHPPSRRCTRHGIDPTQRLSSHHTNRHSTYRLAAADPPRRRRHLVGSPGHLAKDRTKDSGTANNARQRLCRVLDRYVRSTPYQTRKYSSDSEMYCKKSRAVLLTQHREVTTNTPAPSYPTWLRDSDPTPPCRPRVRNGRSQELQRPVRRPNTTMRNVLRPSRRMRP